ncbi:MAG: DEAD/DEAH box helicase [Candidatus Aminicenantes bacterium]|nr:DEAD/DEAH box helicase [Candidatus Aminicenantes bacterium]
MIHEISYNFELDDFQKRAIRAVEKDCSVIVSAPTGAGKTVIAEHVMKKCLNQGDGVIYTAPIKALSNQKFREFNSLFPGKVGIITGDVSINHTAPLLIMTTEIFRNRILEKKFSFSQHTWIIFDEIHYLDDVERGTVWEESLIFLPAHMRFVGLSATIPNLNEFAAWLNGLHHNEISVVKEENRPVPLHYYFQCRGKIIDNLGILKRLAFGKRRNADIGSRYGRGSKSESLIRHLLKSNRVPCIYFSFSRKRCEYLAEKALFHDFLNAEERQRALAIYDRLSIQFDIFNAERTQNLRACIEKGIAYHHAGIHPMLKEIIEQLFSRRLIKIIFTTETFALGINMPAHAVVLDDLKKKYGRFYRHLKTRDFSQMAGRSGRRGIDKEGYVYSRINPEELSFRELNQILYSPPEPILSRFNVSYATILNLYETYGETIIDIYPRSFHFFQEKDKKHSPGLEQMKSRLKILKRLGFIQNQRLTSKGLFARHVYGYELPLSELYSTGILETLSPRQLGMLCLAVVYEPRPYKKIPKFSNEVRSLRTITSRIVKLINQREKKYRIKPLSKKYFFDLSSSLIVWMEKKSFSEAINEANHDEGEVIRFYRMSIQILRELKDTPISSGFKDRIKQAITLINYGVIDAENQLRQVADVEVS